MKCVLITGGTGFVGTHLIQSLAAKTSKIFVLASGVDAPHQPEVTHYQVDIRNWNEVNSVVQEANPNRIYHLAGISSVDISWSNPRLTFEVNVLGACNVLEAAMRLPSPPSILNVSTSQVYGSSGGILTEASPINPDNPYSASKAMAELLLVQYRKCLHGGIVSVRPFNHTGRAVAQFCAALNREAICGNRSWFAPTETCGWGHRCEARFHRCSGCDSSLHCIARQRYSR